jgi:hypothetical protein
VLGYNVTLTLSAAVAHGDVVALGYTRVSGREVQDLNANLAESFTSQAVSNVTAAPGVRLINQARVVNPAGRVAGTRRPGEGGGV